MLLIPTEEDGVSLEEFHADPPAGWNQPFELGRSLRLDRLAGGEADLVMDACDAAGHNFEPARQFGQRVSFIRPLSQAEYERDPFGWDPENTIGDAYRLSRLVRDNGFSTEYAARIVTRADGRQEVIPVGSAQSDFAFWLKPGRHWLTELEAVELRDLLAAYWESQDQLPERIRTAVWFNEYAAWTRYLEVRLPLTVTASEALFNTSKLRLRRQFEERVRAAGAELGISLGQRLLRRAYVARSEGVHGARISTLEPGRFHQTAAELAQVQDVLRGVIRRAIEHPDYAARFADAESVRRAWPVRTPWSWRRFWRTRPQL